jgi:hypothetical protein
VQLHLSFKNQGAVEQTLIVGLGTYKGRNLVVSLGWEFLEQEPEPPILHYHLKIKNQVLDSVFISSHLVFEIVA